MSFSLDYSLLFQSQDSTSVDPLTALVASATRGSGGGASALNALRVAERDETKDVASTAKQPDVKRAVERFNQAVVKATDAKTLLKDPAALQVLLTANGLGDQAGFPALAQKALLSDPDDKKSLANQLPDTRWKSAAQTYQFATKGLSVLRDPKVLATVANGYAEVVWRKSVDAATPGLSAALTFRSRAASVGSVDEILGDKTLRDVVTTALGIPKEIAFQELPAQEKAISDRLDIKKLKDPAFVEQFAQRYLLAAQQQTSGDNTPTLGDLAAKAASLVV